ncbi:ATP-dependent DNA helicase RecG [Hominiventricola filiformis]|uniref:ATP-dependent DNA helicase RecG n=1 Tax=Hominiventricola filiformis TaxID=2885352 RepID=A0AAE3AA17_9FIRM|nr:ATP-dependent DNA helicase RecG [Hominiventricola filiformis]MCC2126173.1 ATP-dependent DNA helicase RecG [Hominiventricola filiformis]
MNLHSPVTDLKGIGEKTAVPFAKAGIHTVQDLIEYYPRAYELFEEPTEPEEMEDGKKYAVHAWVQSVSPVKRFKRYQIFSAQLKTGDTVIQAAWFNMPFLRNYFQKGGQYIFRGVVTVRNGQYRMEQPEHYTLADYEKLLYIMQPKYPLVSGLTEKMVTKAVRQVLANDQIRVPEYLPDAWLSDYDLEEEWEALRQIHFPKDDGAMRKARKRIVFDEFLMFILGIRKMKEHQEELVSQISMVEVAETSRLIETLPYELTGAQKRVWKEIVSDMTGGKVMSRLVQGDVGSGKTILAVLALIMTGCNGCQGALMVPTEVLARQHFESVKEILEEHQIPLVPVLLTGSMTAKEKRLAKAEIESGSAQIIIGTHALIQEDVQYYRLALVVTDEQHRFGVRQRETLADKGITPHVLVMSATPIPRTLAIIVYGDLDISVVDEMPAHRLPIKNCVVDESYRPNAYRFMEKEVAAGHQVYIICPMVEESDELELENVTDYTEKLQKILPMIRIACLHGKMKPKEKNEIMERFAAGDIQILISTTVIEVGINVPNATVMMVENAERFGLAQLHQLRGRVGRGSAQSYCIFMSGSKGKETRKRLEVLNKSNDGFYIASEDLKLRGPGDLFGIRQSGILEFRMGDVFQDSAVLGQASEAAGRLLKEDPQLLDPLYEGIRKKLEHIISQSSESLRL